VEIGCGLCGCLGVRPVVGLGAGAVRGVPGRVRCVLIAAPAEGRAAASAVGTGGPDGSGRSWSFWSFRVNPVVLVVLVVSVVLVVLVVPIVSTVPTPRGVRAISWRSARRCRERRYGARSAAAVHRRRAAWGRPNAVRRARGDAWSRLPGDGPAAGGRPTGTAHRDRPPGPPTGTAHRDRRTEPIGGRRAARPGCRVGRSMVAKRSRVGREPVRPACEVGPSPL
jgi:hypothetical protein